MSSKQAKSSSVTSAEHQLRVEEVLGFLLKCPANRKHKAVVAFCTERWDTHPRTADKYREEALALHGKLTEPRRNAERGRTRADIDRMLDEAWKQKNLVAVGRAIELRMKLFGLAAPDRLEVEDVTEREVRALADWPERELEERLAELRANGGATSH